MDLSMLSSIVLCRPATGLLKIMIQGSYTTGMKSTFLKNLIPKLLTEQYNPKSYLKKTIHFLKNMILLKEYDPLP